MLKQPVVVDRLSRLLNSAADCYKKETQMRLFFFGLNSSIDQQSIFMMLDKWRQEQLLCERRSLRADFLADC